MSSRVKSLAVFFPVAGACRSPVTGLAREQARKRNGDVLEKSTNALIHIYMNVFIYFLDLIFLDLF